MYFTHKSIIVGGKTMGNNNYTKEENLILKKAIAIFTPHSSKD